MSATIILSGRREFLQIDRMTTEYLFSYGTLQLDAVQMATFGRLLSGAVDVLSKFELVPIEIDDEETVALSGKSTHTIARYTGQSSDRISGTVYALTSAELDSADSYEADAYVRVAVELESGQRSWVYVDAQCHPPID